MIGYVRADWPAPFSVTIGYPRADKLGRNGFECIGRRCLVDRERCVQATFMHSAIENYSMLHLQRWLSAGTFGIPGCVEILEEPMHRLLVSRCHIATEARFCCLNSVPWQCVI